MTRVMGIVNVTPDSFSDGGKFFTPEEAVRRAVNIVGEGADIVDIGGESTRPGATPLEWRDEWARVEPILAELVRRFAADRCGAKISVDTYHPETAERALAAGAKIVNCVYAAAVGSMASVVTGSGDDAELVVPAASFGVVPGLKEMLPRLYLDPMIGFDTTREDDLRLLKSIPELAKTGRVLVGASRKRIVKKLTGERVTGKNLGGNLGLAVWCAMHGASVVRVHDVRETVQAIKVVSSLEP